MEKKENQKQVICDSIIDKFKKRKRCTKRIASNITLNLISVSILPHNVCWSDMEGFVTRRFGPFSHYFRNAKNEIIAGMRFNVTYHCKGQYNANGLYLAEATITPYKIFAHPGYELICNVTASDPINYGTKANPIAGFVLKVQTQVRSRHPLMSNPLNLGQQDATQQSSTQQDSTQQSSTQQSSNQQDLKQLSSNQQSSTQQNSYQINIEEVSMLSDILLKSKALQSKVVNCKNLITKNIVLPKPNRRTKCVVPTKISHHRNSKVNVEEQCLSVLIRGDCQVYLLSDYM